MKRLLLLLAVLGLGCLRPRDCLELCATHGVSSFQADGRCECNKPPDRLNVVDAAGACGEAVFSVTEWTMEWTPEKETFRCVGSTPSLGVKRVRPPAKVEKEGT